MENPIVSVKNELYRVHKLLNAGQSKAKHRRKNLILPLQGAHESSISMIITSENVWFFLNILKSTNRRIFFKTYCCTELNAQVLSNLSNSSNKIDGNI